MRLSMGCRVRWGGLALVPVLFGAIGVVPAQAAGAWSSPVALPGACGTSGTASLAVDTASLPAGGTWTAARTLATRGLGVDLAVNSAGAAIIAWNGIDTAILADSGTVLGGFAAPVAVSPSYGRGAHPQVALNDAGSASLAWSIGTTNKAATRSPGGIWSAPTQLSASSSGGADTAIDGAGNAVAVFEELYPVGLGTATPLYASWRPADGSWGPAIQLTALTDSASGHVAADAAGTFVVGYADSATATVDAYTLPALANFGQAAVVGPGGLTNLKIAAGHAARICGAGASQEPVS